MKTLKARIHKWIQHKVVLSRVSREWYSNDARRNSLAMAKQIDAWMMKECDFRRIAEYVLMRERTLINILPHEKNNSYINQVNELLGIIIELKEFVNPKKQAA